MTINHEKNTFCKKCHLGFLLFISNEILKYLNIAKSRLESKLTQENVQQTRTDTILLVGGLKNEKCWLLGSTENCVLAIPDHYFLALENPS